MIKQNIGKIAGLAIAAAIGIGASSSASGALSWTLQNEFSGGATPSGYITALFEQAGANNVKLTLESHLGAGEFATEWDFNLTPDAFVSTITAAFQAGSSSGTFTAPAPTFGLNAYQADGDGKYDIMFSFASGPPNSRFNQTDKAVYLFTATGLTEAAFNTLSQPAGGHGPFVTAAHVQGITDTGDGTSGWVTVVPEPTTMIAGALLLLPFGASTIRFLRKNRTA